MGGCNEYAVLPRAWIVVRVPGNVSSATVTVRQSPSQPHAVLSSTTAESPQSSVSSSVPLHGRMTRTRSLTSRSRPSFVGCCLYLRDEARPERGLPNQKTDKTQSPDFVFGPT